ncbi:MAG: tetratricopeptide repeat protein [Elusimicrobiales bacterium]
MDISLIYPSFFTVFTYKKNFKVGIRLITKSVIVFVVGFSVYIYLYFLSKSDPLINWSDPSDIKNLIDIITRKSYGSTLDLISLKYKRGENFIPNLKAYFIHIIKNFNILIIFSFYGFYKMFKEKNKDIYFFILLFFIPGPFFLYLANMPPNPHSLSIVEPYYLVPNIAILFMTFFGLRAIDKKISFFLAIVSIFFTIFINFNHYNRKNLRITETFSKDILNNLPQNSIIVAKKDVQVFSLWYYRYVEKIREDVDVIAQGLTGAKWYHKSRINKDIVILHLDSKENWEMFKEINNKRVFATTDCEIPSDLKIKHYGLYVEIEPENEKTDIDMISKLSYKTIKPPYNDFFVYDLAAQYSLAITNIISKNLGEKTKHSILLEYLNDAEQLDEMNKNIYFYRGIIYSDEAKWDKALESFIKAKSILFELKRRAKLYKSFKEVFDSINIDISYAYLNMGVCYEKLNNFVESEKSYFYALKFNPLLYTAHYNLAVLYWDKDKNRSKIHLIEALKINPAYSQARYYLEILESSKNPINKY